MPRMLEHEDVRERGLVKSKAQTWRDIRDGLFFKPTPLGNRNAWPEDLADYYSELVAAGFDRRTATTMVEERRAQQRAALIAAAKRDSEA
jgi:hypothetical protein